MKPNYFRLTLVIILISILYACSRNITEGPYFATGIKIGEVSQEEAIIWVRLTENPERVGNDAPMPEVRYKDPETGEMIERRGRPDVTPVVTYPGGHTIKTIQGASPGREGKVRLKFRAVGDQKWIKMDWHNHCVLLRPRTSGQVAFLHAHMRESAAVALRPELYVKYIKGG